MLLLPDLQGPSTNPSSADKQGDEEIRLPVSDVSAALLADALLVNKPAEAVDRIVRLLPAEPGLSLWCLLNATTDAQQPATFYDLADWIIRSHGDVLQWPDGAPPSGEISAQQLRRWQVLYETSVERLEVGRWTVDRDTDLLNDPTAVTDLLANAEAWLLSCLQAERGPIRNVLPAWLSHSIEGRKGSIAACFDSLDEADRRAARRHAAASRARWITPGLFGSALLPRTTALLARLATLETRFDQELETAKLEAMAEFAAGAGHEINNPLAVISGRAQLLIPGETDPERRRDLALIHTQAMRVYEMIADMMLAARPPWPELEPVELSRLLTKLVEDMAAKAALRDIQLCWQPPDEPLIVTADPIQLAVAMRALCDNALEAIGGQGKIELIARRSPSQRRIEIAVRDTGPGISAAIRDHLFDPYFSGREAGRGLGVGLSKCRSIIDRHGGTIAVESEPGHGAIFVVTLPQPASQDETQPPQDRSV